MLTPYEYLFKIRQELFIHWGFFITVTISTIGFLLLRTKETVPLPKHLIACIFIIFSLIMISSFWKITRDYNMCAKDVKVVSQIQNYPDDGFIKFTANYDYRKLLIGCCTQIFLISAVVIILIYKI